MVGYWSLLNCIVEWLYSWSSIWSGSWIVDRGIVLASHCSVIWGLNGKQEQSYFQIQLVAFRNQSLKYETLILSSDFRVHSFGRKWMSIFVFGRKWNFILAYGRKWKMHYRSASVGLYITERSWSWDAKSVLVLRTIGLVLKLRSWSWKSLLHYFLFLWVSHARSARLHLLRRPTCHWHQFWDRKVLPVAVFAIHASHTA